MNIEKLPSGSYRARITVNKKVYRTTFDHKPSEREIMLAFADKITDSSVITKHITFQAAAIQYINIKHDVLSPSTLRDYSRYCDRLSDTFVNLYIDKITPQDIQIEINKLAQTKSPKTVRNLNGFIVPVIKMFRPNFAFNTTLPQKEEI